MLSNNSGPLLFGSNFLTDDFKLEHFAMLSNDSDPLLFGSNIRSDAFKLESYLNLIRWIFIIRIQMFRRL